jgi:hypothetical protein
LANVARGREDGVERWAQRAGRVLPDEVEREGERLAKGEQPQVAVGGVERGVGR